MITKSRRIVLHLVQNVNFILATKEHLWSTKRSTIFGECYRAGEDEAHTIMALTRVVPTCWIDPGVTAVT